MKTWSKWKEWIYRGYIELVKEFWNEFTLLGKICFFWMIPILWIIVTVLILISILLSFIPPIIDFIMALFIKSHNKHVIE